MGHMTSSPPWRPGPRTDYTNTHEANSELSQLLFPLSEVYLRASLPWGARPFCPADPHKQMSSHWAFSDTVISSLIVTPLKESNLGRQDDP
ncbi:hypothetical protein EYF80_026439 [Liparis tanakae]|uniref:Uncharacterized protein n=1 Tax=Liparis tanakae TaxID=230148 RepID=A0A4Z2HBS3_9TELE|nr:hypothetical protein EYF80_026439 [Liparis tanakae]